MKSVGILLAVAAYTLGSWGYLIVKGYNVTLAEWVSPLHPYAGKWPPLCVPPGYIFPTNKAAGVECKAPTPGGISNSPEIKRVNRAAKQSGRVSPGQVGGRY